MLARAASCSLQESPCNIHSAPPQRQRGTLLQISPIHPGWNRVMPLGVANKLNTSAVETAKSASPTQYSRLLLSILNLSFHDVLLRLEGGCFTWIFVKIGRCKYVVSRTLLGLTASLAAEVHLYVELSLKPSMFYRFLSCQVQ